MLLRWVELRDFRNHAHTKLKPIPEGLLVVVGANGEGKTNLLEGMHFLYALQSPRASASEPLVRHGASSGFVRGEFQTRDGKVLVEAEVKTKGANKVQVNRSPVRRRRDLRKQVRSVLFGPFDLPVITRRPVATARVHGRGRRRAGAGVRHAHDDLRARRAPAEPPAEGTRRAGRAAATSHMGRPARRDRDRGDRGPRRGRRGARRCGLGGLRRRRRVPAGGPVRAERPGRRQDRGRGGLPGAPGGAAGRRAPAAGLPGRPPPRRPRARGPRPRRPGVRQPRRDVGGRAVAPTGRRRRGRGRRSGSRRS